MSVSVDDIKFRKSVRQTDTSTNGGRKGNVQVISGARHNLFPRVTKAERTNGITRYRKQFWSNENPSDQSAYGVLIFFEFPSTGDDYYQLALGTQTDVQSDIGGNIIWNGIGKLNTSLSGAETQVVLEMSDNTFDFYNGSYLHISNKLQTSQTVSAGVKVGDSVEEIGGTWQKIASTNEVVYPKGLYVGNNNVLSITDSTNEEWATIKAMQTTDEVIGTGVAGNQTPSLNNLSPVRGIQGKGEYAPVVKATCGGIEREVTINPDGSCAGYCSAGQLDLTTGNWVSPITWSTAPDSGTGIKIDWADIPYSYSGNTVTVELDTAIANSYSAANTYASGCLKVDEVKATFDQVNINSGNGTYDISGFPIGLFNDGTEEDSFTIQFTSSTTFNCSSMYLGSLGSGTISGDYTPMNPNTGQYLFALRSGGWGGTWQSGDTLTFRTHPSAVPIWLKEEVPTGTAEEPNNLLVLGWYAE